MKVLGISVITLLMLAWLPMSASANSASKYLSVQCPGGYGLQKSGSKFRCSKPNGHYYKYKTASCANILNIIPGVNWKLIYVSQVPNVKGWGCCSGGIAAAQSCERIDSKTCPSGYAANYKAGENSKSKTCRKKVAKSAYAHPYFHKH